MEALTRLVTDSLVRHGLDRPIDPCRLQWSSWFRCDSPHSLLVVPSKPGIFALAEEVMDLGAGNDLGGPGLEPGQAEASARRMLAVLQFSEDDDMAFTLDRMFTRINPMRARLASGRCFLRFVVLEDEDQRRSICAALNQWIRSSLEKATGLPAEFSSSLELTESVAQTPASAFASATKASQQPPSAKEKIVMFPAPHLNSCAARNLDSSQPFPSGF